MIFVDKNGITFETENSNSPKLIPEPKFIIWFEPDRLSCNLNYVMPVRVLVRPLDELNVTIPSSDAFNLIDTSKLDGVSDWETIREMDSKLFTDSLSFSDGVSVVRGYKMITFYIAARYDKEETVVCNIRISNPTEHKYSLIRIGATFYDECEELNVVASNMGIKLPADICKAFWGCNFHEYHPDRVMERDKLKELLFNYMGIKGECGNYNSAIQALQWFGWGDKIELSQLVKLGNNLSSLYMNDYFNSFTDLPVTFDKFKRTTLLSLKVHLKEFAGLGVAKLVQDYNGDENPLYSLPSEDGPQWEMSSELFGEMYIDGLSDAESNIRDEDIAASMWSMQTSVFSTHSKYINTVTTELALKLACLAELYEKYFLPVQLNVLSSSVVDHVTATPFKILVGTYSHINNTYDNITPREYNVVFTKRDYVVRVDGYKQYIDLTFDIETEHDYGSCGVYLSDCDGELLYHSLTGWSDDKTLVIEVPVENFATSPTNAKHLAVLVDGRWYETTINVRYPLLTLTPGKLVYRGEDDVFETDMFLSRKVDAPECVWIETQDIFIPLGK